MKTLRDQLNEMSNPKVLDLSYKASQLLCIAKQMDALLEECAGLINDWKEEYGMASFIPVAEKLKQAGYGV